MTHKKIKAAIDSVEDYFRGLCGEITPDKRLVVVLTLLVIFTGISLYFTVYSIYSIGKSVGERNSIEQVERSEYFPFEIPPEETDSEEIEE